MRTWKEEAYVRVSPMYWTLVAVMSHRAGRRDKVNCVHLYHGVKLLPCWYCGTMVVHCLTMVVLRYHGGTQVLLGYCGGGTLEVFITPKSDYSSTWGQEDEWTEGPGSLSSTDVGIWTTLGPPPGRNVGGTLHTCAYCTLQLRGEYKAWQTL